MRLQVGFIYTRDFASYPGDQTRISHLSAFFVRKGTFNDFKTRCKNERANEPLGMCKKTANKTGFVPIIDDLQLRRFHAFDWGKLMDANPTEKVNFERSIDLNFGKTRFFFPMGGGRGELSHSCFTYFTNTNFLSFPPLNQVLKRLALNTLQFFVYLPIR